MFPEGLTLTKSWRTHYTSTDTCREVWRGSCCRRAADTPCRDHRDQRSGPNSWGSERTVAPPAPGADWILFVWSPAAHSSASCLTETGDHLVYYYDPQQYEHEFKWWSRRSHRILFSSLFLSFSSFCSTFRIISLSCSSRKERFRSSPTSSIIPTVYNPLVNSAKQRHCMEGCQIPTTSCCERSARVLQPALSGTSVLCFLL